MCRTQAGMLRAAELRMKSVISLLFCLFVSCLAGVDRDVPILSQEQLHRVKRIIGGADVDEGKWPWLVSLQGKIPTNTFFGIPVSYKKVYCGASLISERWVVTAAHCFMEGLDTEYSLQPKYWHAKLGDIEMDRGFVDGIMDSIGELIDDDSLQDWYIHADKIIIHPQYDAKDLWLNDIALIRLEEDVPHGSEVLPHIQSVDLPQPNDLTFPAVGQQCVMKGWGCTANGGNVIGTAREVTLPKIQDKECYRFWGISKNNDRLCAGYVSSGEFGICSGDSGGPLVCKDSSGNWIQVGIASFTSANRPGRVPAVFTRVSSYRKWIEAEMEANNPLEPRINVLDTLRDLWDIWTDDDDEKDVS